jgi:hypothetical protein
MLLHDGGANPVVSNGQRVAHGFDGERVVEMAAPRMIGA